jgi:uncharacterized protein YjbI with pentapeptide repeats
MANPDHVAVLKQGTKHWNAWRTSNPDIRPDLSHIDFTSEFPSENGVYNLPHFEQCDFSSCDMRMSSLRNGTFMHCSFIDAYLPYADLVDAYFQSCTFGNAMMRVARIGSATFASCEFVHSDLSYCSAQETDFTDSRILYSKLEHVAFAGTVFTNARIEDCQVHGISTWDVKTTRLKQKNLVITTEGQAEINVDSIEIAQFLYLIINNKKIRHVIDTITSKVVLILGNFSPETKKRLNSARTQLRGHGYVPVMFDFAPPTSRNLMETVLTIANMAAFVVADLTKPRSIPHELSAIVPRLQSVTVYPIIAESEREYGMFSELVQYPSVKPIKRYRKGTRAVIAEIVAEELDQGST